MLSRVNLAPDAALPAECQQFAVARSVAVEAVTRSPRWAPRFGLLVYRIFLELDVWANRAPAVATSATALQQQQGGGSKHAAAGNAARHALGMPTALVLSASRSGGIDTAIHLVLVANGRVEAAPRCHAAAAGTAKGDASFMTNASDDAAGSDDGMASVRLSPQNRGHSPQHQHHDSRMLTVPTLLAPPPLPSRQTRNPLLNDLSESLLNATANRGPAAYAAAASTYVPRTEAGIRAVHSERKRRQLLVEVFGTDTVFDFGNEGAGDDDEAAGHAASSAVGAGRTTSPEHRSPSPPGSADRAGSPPVQASMSPSPGRAEASSVGAAPPSRSRHQCDRHRRRKQERRLRSSSPAEASLPPPPETAPSAAAGGDGGREEHGRTPSPPTADHHSADDGLRNDNEL